MCRYSKRCAGLALLEATASLVVLLPVCLGVFDLFRIFETRAVLNHAAKLTLRNLTAIDGSGVNVEAALGADRFQWCMRRWDGLDQFQREERPACLDLGGPLPAGETPGACRHPAPGAACERRVIEQTGARGAKRELDSAKAADEWGKQEVSAVLPEARVECSDLSLPHCVRISLARGPQALAPQADDQAPRSWRERGLMLTIEYHLPMYILPDLGPFAASNLITARAWGRAEAGYLDPRLFVRHTDR